MHWRTVFIAAITATSLVACAFSGVEDTPLFLVPDSVIRDIRTIAVTPVIATGETHVSEDATAIMEAAFEEYLKEAGFSVVPAFEHIGIWQHIADEFGGFFDVYTGEPDEELLAVAKERLRSELRERFQVDALLYPELWEGTVPFYGGVATWDGASQSVFGAYGLNGMVNALSLVVVLEDVTGKELFSNGIGFATIEAWHRSSWLPVDLESVVGDPRLVSKAVTDVLTPIFKAIEADSAASVSP